MRSKHADGRGWFFRTAYLDEVHKVPAAKPAKPFMEREKINEGFAALRAELAASARAQGNAPRDAGRSIADLVAEHLAPIAAETPSPGTDG